MQYLMNSFWNFLDRTPFVNFVYLLDMVQSYTKVVAIKKMKEPKKTNIEQQTGRFILITNIDLGYKCKSDVENSFIIKHLTKRKVGACFLLRLCNNTLVEPKSHEF